MRKIGTGREIGDKWVRDAQCRPGLPDGTKLYAFQIWQTGWRSLTNWDGSEGEDYAVTADGERVYRRSRMSGRVGRWHRIITMTADSPAATWIARH